MSTLTPTLLNRLLASEREPNARVRALKAPLDGRSTPSSHAALIAAALRTRGHATTESPLLVLANNAIDLYANARAGTTPRIVAQLPQIRPLVTEVTARLRACVEEGR